MRSIRLWRSFPEDKQKSSCPSHWQSVLTQNNNILILLGLEAEKCDFMEEFLPIRDAQFQRRFTDLAGVKVKSQESFQFLKLQIIYHLHEWIDMNKSCIGQFEHSVTTFFVREELGWISVWLAQENTHLTQDNNYCEECVLAHTLLDCEIASSHIILHLRWFTVYS